MVRLKKIFALIFLCLFLFSLVGIGLALQPNPVLNSPSNVFLSNPDAASKNGEPWLTGFNYRKSVLIYNSTGAGTNYVSEINVWKGEPAVIRWNYVETTSSDVNAHQSVATDGTYFYTGSRGDPDNFWFYKYDSSWNLVDSRNTTDDEPSAKEQINGIFCKDGKLFISAHDYAPDDKSWVVIYNATTLGFIEYYALNDSENSQIEHRSEGIVWEDGYWWVCWADWMKITKYNSTWGYVADYNLTYDIDSGVYDIGYDGIIWIGDFIYANIHELKYPTVCDAYYWNGSGFQEAGRLKQPTQYCTSGLYLDPDGETVWFAERSHGGVANDDRVVKATFTKGLGCESHCKDDFGDIRFTDNDTTTELDYWMEEKTDGYKATFWVEIADSLSSSNATIYVYYGNAAGTTTSNGNSTFVLFDDFDTLDTDKWNTQDNPSVSGGELVLDNNDGICSKTLYDVGYHAESYATCDEQDVMFISLTGDNFNLTDQINIGSSDGGGYDDNYDALQFHIEKDDVAYSPTIYLDAWHDVRNTYYNYYVKWISSNLVTRGQEANSHNFTDSDYIETENMSVCIRVWNSSQESTINVDWVFLRKIVETEPEQQTWGSEEEGSEGWLSDASISVWRSFVAEDQYTGYPISDTGYTDMMFDDDVRARVVTAYGIPTPYAYLGTWFVAGSGDTFRIDLDIPDSNITHYDLSFYNWTSEAWDKQGDNLAEGTTHNYTVGGDYVNSRGHLYTKVTTDESLSSTGNAYVDADIMNVEETAFYTVDAEYKYSGGSIYHRTSVTGWESEPSWCYNRQHHWVFAPFEWSLENTSGAVVCDDFNFQYPLGGFLIRVQTSSGYSAYFVHDGSYGVRWNDDTYPSSVWSYEDWGANCSNSQDGDNTTVWSKYGEAGTDYYDWNVNTTNNGGKIPAGTWNVLIYVSEYWENVSSGTGLSLRLDFDNGSYYDVAICSTNSTDFYFEHELTTDSPINQIGFYHSHPSQTELQSIIDYVKFCSENPYNSYQINSSASENGGFEYGNTSEWTETGGGTGDFTIVTSPVFEGSYALKINTTSSGIYVRRTIYDDNAVSFAVRREGMWERNVNEGFIRISNGSKLVNYYFTDNYNDTIWGGDADTNTYRKPIVSNGWTVIAMNPFETFLDEWGTRPDSLTIDFGAFGTGSEIYYDNFQVWKQNLTHTNPTETSVTASGTIKLIDGYDEPTSTQNINLSLWQESTLKESHLVSGSFEQSFTYTLRGGHEYALRTAGSRDYQYENFTTEDWITDFNAWYNIMDIHFTLTLETYPLKDIDTIIIDLAKDSTLWDSATHPNDHYRFTWQNTTKTWTTSPIVSIMVSQNPTDWNADNGEWTLWAVLETVPQGWEARVNITTSNNDDVETDSVTGSGGGDGGGGGGGGGGIWLPPGTVETIATINAGAIQDKITAQQQYQMIAVLLLMSFTIVIGYAYTQFKSPKKKRGGWLKSKKKGW